MDNLLEEVVERQKLSRFDTVMFLAYPLLLSGISASVWVLSQRTIQDWMVGRVLELIPGLVLFVTVFSIFFLVILAWNIVHFIRGYLGDDIRARIRASHNVVASLGWLIGVMLVLFAVLPVFDLAARAAKGLISVLSWILAFAFGVSIWLTASSFWDEVTLWFWRKIALWSEKNLPHMLASAHVSFAGVLFYSAARARKPRGWRVGCVVICVIYSIMVALAAQARGLGGTGAYYIAFLIVLVIVTTAVLFQAKLKTILRSKRNRQTILDEYKDP